MTKRELCNMWESSGWLQLPFKRVTQSKMLVDWGGEFQGADGAKSTDSTD